MSEPDGDPIVDPAVESSGVDLAVEGPGAPPRENGEVVFEAPWQRRAFGIALSLCEEGAYDWSVFQAALIARVAESEAAEGPFDYWGAWLAALDDVTTDLGLTDPAQVKAAAEELATHHSH